MNVPVWPLYKANRIKRWSSQHLPGRHRRGAWGLYELDEQIKAYAAGQPIKKNKFPHQIVNNLFCHNSKVQENGYNEEENKMVKETRKIFGDPKICVTATCVRVPVPRAHCESINIEFEKPDDPGAGAGDPLQGPRREDRRLTRRRATSRCRWRPATRTTCYVGRIRQDISRDGGRGIDLFVSRRPAPQGAATNAIQIAELLLK